MDFGSPERGQECVWGQHGKGPANQEGLLERVGVFSPEKRKGEEWFGTPVAPNGRTEAIDGITGRKIPIHQSQTYLII